MVWSRANLEKSLFEEPGYKTLVIIRDGSTIPSNNGTRLYHFRLVLENDALSLFCFWVLVQTSIPSMSVANLVKEVQAEWKGLLLALNGVIGSSLHGEPLVTWKSARKKLSKGGLLGCLETSIDFLDDVAKGWFSDLPRFPDEKKNCEDAPLDIWVYIQKLKRENALVMVLELTLKNLFNLMDNLGSRAAISNGSASELYFSQKYVMQDLALYLRSHRSLVHKKRLIRLRKKRSLQGKWEMLNRKSFQAQVVSVHKGPINETQCFEMNFSDTEALVYSTTVLKDEGLRFS